MTSTVVCLHQRLALLLSNVNSNSDPYVGSLRLVAEDEQLAVAKAVQKIDFSIGAHR